LSGASVKAASGARARRGRQRDDTKPSIAVLPFTNMSGDPEQEYFSDGITEDIITDLSKISGLFVVARNTAFTFKGKALNVEEVGRELEVANAPAAYFLMVVIRCDWPRPRKQPPTMPIGRGLFHLA
jgi:adenylate cyclase